jgi:ribonuclease HI
MTATPRETIEIFSDGACSGNPGPGGWGTILRYGGHEKELSGFATLTTNNRMELSAALAGLQALKRPCQVRVTSDSQYLCKGMTTWIFSWKKKGWKNSKREEVVNRDLWEELDRQAQRDLAGGARMAGHCRGLR